MQAETQNWLMPLCRYLEATWWATDIRTSLWGYPFIQLIHFSGLSLWLGTSIAGDLRLIRVGKKPQTATEVRDELFVWNWIGFCTVVTGGFLLFSARATAYIINPAFRTKLFMLVPLALLWHVFVQTKTSMWEKTTSNTGRLAGLVEVILWLAVVAAAVEIPSY
jgi:hypothetical protein